MKYDITKGSEKDFEQAPDWAMVLLKHNNGRCVFAESKSNGAKRTEMYSAGYCIIVVADEYEIIAERRPITEPVWDGEGLPPVGVECEALFTSQGSVFERAKILHVGDDVVVGRWLTGKNSGGLFDYMYVPHDYRPIRSPEDVARDEAIAAMCDIGYTLPAAIRFSKEEMSALYDALSAGKIPGVKLDGAE